MEAFIRFLRKKVPSRYLTRSTAGRTAPAIPSLLSRSNQGEKDHGSYLELDAASIVSDAFEWWDAHLKSLDLLAAICGYFASNILGFGATRWCVSAQDTGVTNHMRWLSSVRLRKVACLLAWTTNKCIIMILWSVRAVTAGKAPPPFPYSPLHSGVDLYNASKCTISKTQWLWGTYKASEVKGTIILNTQESLLPPVTYILQELGILAKRIVSTCGHLLHQLLLLPWPSASLTFHTTTGQLFTPLQISLLHHCSQVNI